LLFVWEILPTLIVLLYFRHIPKTTHIRAWSCCRLCPWWCYGPHSQEELLAVSGSSPREDSDGRNGISHMHYHDGGGFVDRGDVDDIYPSIYQNYFPTHLGPVHESPTKPSAPPMLFPSLTSDFSDSNSNNTLNTSSNLTTTSSTGIRAAAPQPSESIYEVGHDDHESSSGSGSDFEEDENEQDQHLNLSSQTHHGQHHGQHHSQHSQHSHSHHSHDLPGRIVRTGAPNPTPPPA